MQNPPLLISWRTDAPSALVVALVALPLCLGVALASGVPLMAGLIAGVVGGIVVGMISRSPLSVSGPAAGLTTIVLAAVQGLPSYEAFLLAVCLAGGMQIAFGLLRLGVVGDFIPSAVIKGMLAAIGLILILKQLPHAVGYDADFEGDESFLQMAGENTFNALAHMLNHLSLSATAIAAVSLLFLFWWDGRQKAQTNLLRYVPGPLVVVAFGVMAQMLLSSFAPDYALRPDQLVAVPVAESANAFFAQFHTPDLSFLAHRAIWVAAATIALVASLESLLSIEAIDKLDPLKRVTPTNRELFAQGVGNIVSGALGGIPVTSVIVRSSANVEAGARTRLSTMLHGVLLLVCVVAIPGILNLIPLSALAAVLIAVGYKLTKPAIFQQKYERGWRHFVPFVVTIAVILLTDLLMGIATGLVVAALFVLAQNLRAPIQHVVDGTNHLLRFKKDLFFLHKAALKHELDRIPEGASLLIDITRAGYIDLDNIDILNDFLQAAKHKEITVTFKYPEGSPIIASLGSAAHA